MEIFKRYSAIFSKIKVLLFSLFAPLLLVYLNLRCELTNCSFSHIQFVKPAHTKDYFSYPAFNLIIGFIILQFSISKVYGYVYARWNSNGKQASVKNTSGGLLSLFVFVGLIFGLNSLRPAIFYGLHKEHLRFLIAAWCICLCILLLRVISSLWVKFLVKDKTNVNSGHDELNNILQINLKKFCFVNVGLVGWAILDVLMIVDYLRIFLYVTDACFVVVTQVIYICNQIYFSDTILFKRTNGHDSIGNMDYNCLQQGLIFLPFTSSLFVKSAIGSGSSTSHMYLCYNTAIFLCGFVLQTLTLKVESDQHKAPEKNLAEVAEPLLGKCFGNYIIKYIWMIKFGGEFFMWTSWVIAGGMSDVCLVVLFVWVCNALVSKRYNLNYNAPQNQHTQVQAVRQDYLAPENQQEAPKTQAPQQDQAEPQNQQGTSQFYLIQDQIARENQGAPLNQVALQTQNQVGPQNHDANVTLRRSNRVKSPPNWMQVYR